MIRPGVRRLFRLRRAVGEELADEIELHLQQRIEQLQRRGMSYEAARAEAERRFAASARARDELYRAAYERERTMRMRGWLQTWYQDAALTVRSFARYPGFTVSVMLTLALGIGATVAIVSVVDGVLLRPLPYHDESRLYALVDRLKTSDDESAQSPLELYRMRELLSTFDGLAGVAHSSVSLTGDGSPEQVPVQRVTDNFFELLGVRAALGQTFRAGDDAVGAEPVAVLSHGLWQRRYGGDAAIIGRTIRVNGRSALVLGVMPQDFEFGNFRSELWLPLNYARDFPGRFLTVVGRLRDGATPSNATTDLTRAMGILALETPKFHDNLAPEIIPLRTRIVGDARMLLIALFGAVLLLLLIAAANVANLLLARSLRRRKEMAVRLSLGAGRTRLVRQLLTESSILSLVGGALGLLLAYGSIRIIMTRIPTALALPRAGEVTMDARIVAMACFATACTALLFGLAPALVGSRADEHSLLLRGGRGNTGGPRLGRARSALVIAQVALVAVLLVGAGLLGRSLWNLQHVELGMDTSQTIAATVARTQRAYPTDDAGRVFFRQILEEVATLPGVSAVGMVQHLPLTGERSTTGINLQGSGDTYNGGGDIRAIGGDFFGTMRMRLLGGRTFTSADNESAPRVFIVNQSLAQQLGGVRQAIGKRIAYSWGGVVDGKVVPISIDAEIVGVVEDVHESGPALEAGPALYRPFEQDPWPTMSIVVRTEGDVDALGRAVTARIQERHPNQPVTVNVLSELVSELVARPRMQLFLVGLFAAMALVLATIGLYGVIAYTVDQRRQEIGVRLAMGATPARVTRMVVRQGITLGGIGLGLGAIVALLTLPVLDTLVYGVPLTDPPTIIAAFTFIMLTTTAASLLPALRASRTDPNAALRSE